MVSTSTVLLAALLGQTATAGGFDRKDDCSIINLVATPDRYDGKRVRVVGFAILRFEGNAIYLSEADATHMITKNAIWLDLSSLAKGKPAGGVDHAYALVEGTFDQDDPGHMGNYAGTIRVTRLEAWPFPIRSKQP